MLPQQALHLPVPMQSTHALSADPEEDESLLCEMLLPSGWPGR